MDTGKKFSGLIKKSACLLLPLNIDTETKPKLPRGRPRKIIDPQDVKPKRPRGRPKKEVPTVNEPKRPRAKGATSKGKLNLSEYNSLTQHCFTVKDRTVFGYNIVVYST